MLELATKSLPVRATPTVDARFVYDAVLSGRSPDTIRAYSGIFAAFSGHLGLSDGMAALHHMVKLDPGTANAVVSGYRTAMVEQEKAPNTINLHLSAIRSVLREAKRFGLINWTLEVRPVKSQDYRDTSGPGHDNYRKLLAKIIERIEAKSGLDPKGRRDLAIIRLMYDTGLRSKEVRNLSLSDVEFSTSIVSIVAKGSRESTRIRVPKAAMDAIVNWVNLHRGSEPGPLWTRMDERTRKAGDLQPIGGRGIFKMVESYGQEIGVKITPHKLRHGGITRAAKLTNGNIVSVQAFSRHADYKTVKRYIDAEQGLAGKVADLVGGDE